MKRDPIISKIPGTDVLFQPTIKTAHNSAYRSQDCVHWRMGYTRRTKTK